MKRVLGRGASLAKASTRLGVQPVSPEEAPKAAPATTKALQSTVELAGETACPAATWCGKSDRLMPAGSGLQKLGSE